MSAAVALVDALEVRSVLKPGDVAGVRSMQEWHARSVS
jgi:hypothetical protein